MRILLISLILMSAASAQNATYTLGGLSETDLRLLGAGLGKLPREVTDEEHGNLWGRVQTQITQQVNAALKAKADVDKAAFDKAVAEAVAKAQTDKPETPQ